MPQPYSTGVDASRQKNNKKVIKHYWTDREYKDEYLSKIIFHYTKPPQLKLDKPVPALKTITLTKPQESDVIIGLSPPKPTLVNVVDGYSPNVPSVTTKDSNENLLKNRTGITDANTASTTTLNTTSTTTVNTNTASTASTDQESSDKTGMRRNKAKKLQAALAAQKAAIEAAGESTSSGATGAIQLTPHPPQIYIIHKSNHPTDPTRTFTNQQTKKWLKFQKRIFQKNMGGKGPATLPEETPLPETSQDGSPSIIGQTSESPTSVSTDGSGQGSSVAGPIIQKPNITLKTKKSLQQDMVTQQLNWTKPAENEPGTGTSSSQEQAQTTEAPQTPLLADPVPGSTIARLENRTVEPTPRSNAGSFFVKAAPTQPPLSPPKFPAPQRRSEIYNYRYPKGIPKSFLLQQEKLLEPSGSPITSDSPIWPSNPMMNASYPNAIILGQQPDSNEPATSPILVQTDNPVDVQQPYSPSDIYAAEQPTSNPEPPEVDTESSEQNQSGQKRLSAFQRLGPVSEPKKPKLTINLNLKKDQPVREVVNETEDDADKYTPVHLRQDMILSSDETVKKYLPAWPWRKNITVRRSATARNSRSVMILEQEKMEEVYDKENIYIQISVKGYPATWTKERVLDAVLDNVKGYSLIPCFIEFTQHECKFLVLRSRSALIVLHKTGFYIHKDGVELTVTISLPVISEKLDFIPRIIIRKRIVMGFMDRRLNLSAFTLQNDLSHFIYFPLNRLTNQKDCIQLQTSIDLNRLVELNLSHNRLTTIAGFDLINVTPNLKHLNLSYNLLEKATVLANDRLLPLKTIHLEGNPLCHDYIDPDHYVKVIRMMFPTVVEIDGVPIHRRGELPALKRNYCPEESQEVAEKFIEIFFPLLDSGSDQRPLVQGMYDDDATLTVTYCYKLRYGPIFRNFRNLFLYARFLDEGETDSVVGAMAITKLINRWPPTEHDPSTFTLDVLYHTEKTTILRVSGVLKLTADTLAKDEHLLAFTRTVVLYSEDEVEYKIQNEMVYWSEPTADASRSAFKDNTADSIEFLIMKLHGKYFVRYGKTFSGIKKPAKLLCAIPTISQKNYDLKIEATTDEDLRDKFLKIFMKLTSMDKKICERCLEINDWNFKLALERFTKLLKLNNLDSLTQEVQASN